MLVLQSVSCMGLNNIYKYLKLRLVTVLKEMYDHGHSVTPMYAIPCHKLSLILLFSEFYTTINIWIFSNTHTVIGQIHGNYLLCNSEYKIHQNINKKIILYKNNK